MEPSPTAATTPMPAQPKSTSSALTFKITHLLIILMFLMPFVEFRCNGVTLTKATGIDLAFGFEMKESKTVSNWSNTMNWDDTYSDSNQNNARRKKDPNSFALASLVLAVLGLGIAFLKIRQQPFLSMCIGILGIITMVGLMIQLNSDIRNEATVQGAEYGVKISYDYTAWYFLALIGFGISAFAGWKLSKKKPTAQPV